MDRNNNMAKELAEALRDARRFIAQTPHGENCFLHDDGGEFDRCFCGKDAEVEFLDEILARYDAPPSKP